MLLCELFDDGGMSSIDKLRSAVLDILTPMVGHDIPYVTVHSVIDQLRMSKPGIYVDAGLITKLLDPAEVEMVKEIQGDRIYLTNPNEDTQNDTSEDQKENNIQKVKDNAIKQAKSQMKSGPSA